MSHGSTVYNFATSLDGNVLVTAIDVSDFPPEVDPGDDPFAATRRAQLKQSNNEGNITPDEDVQADRILQSGGDDGSVIDIMCVYTRAALCAEAGQSSNCNLNAYKYLLDNKCALAVAETVRP